MFNGVEITAEGWGSPSLWSVALCKHNPMTAALPRRIPLTVESCWGTDLEKDRLRVGLDHASHASVASKFPGGLWGPLRGSNSIGPGQDREVAYVTSPSAC